jgi:hypothetical protein
MMSCLQMAPTRPVAEYKIGLQLVPREANARTVLDSSYDSRAARIARCHDVYKRASIRYRTNRRADAGSARRERASRD